MQHVSPSRVAARYLQAATVQVEVLDGPTEKARSRFGSEIVIGRFLTPVPLYRVFDGEELNHILDTGDITGGSYSVAGERAYGAQWGADRDQIALWGENQRGKRLGHELFMAEIEGKDRVFAHLSGADGQLDLGAGTVTLDSAFCSTGLGCSLQIPMSVVRAWYIVENGHPRKATLDELQSMQESGLGQQPREMDLYQGTLLSNLPRRMERALRSEVVAGILEGDYSLSMMQRIKTERDLGVKPNDAMDEAKLGRLIIKTFYKEVEPWGTMWQTSSAEAERDANPSQSDGMTKFSVRIGIIADTVAPHHVADMTDEVAKVKFVDVYVPEKRLWYRVWQPWGKAKIHFVDDSNVVVR